MVRQYFNLAYKLNSSLVVQKYQYSRTCCTYVRLWFLSHKYGHEYFFCYCCIPKLYNIYNCSSLNMFWLYMYLFRVKKTLKSLALLFCNFCFHWMMTIYVPTMYVCASSRIDEPGWADTKYFRKKLYVWIASFLYTVLMMY